MESSDSYTMEYLSKMFEGHRLLWEESHGVSDVLCLPKALELMCRHIDKLEKDLYEKNTP